MPLPDVPRGSSIAAMRAAILALLLLAVWASVALASSASVTATETDHLGFSTSRLTVKRGKVTLKLVNPSANHLQHSIDIKGNGVIAKGKIVNPGKTSTVTATLKKGTYTFYCRLKGHAKDGMRGTLIVK